MDAGRGVPGALAPGGFIDLCVVALELAGGKYFAGSGSSGSCPAYKTTCRLAT